MRHAGDNRIAKTGKTSTFIVLLWKKYGSSFDVWCFPTFV